MSLKLKDGGSGRYLRLQGATVKGGDLTRRHGFLTQGFTKPLAKTDLLY